MSSAKVRWNSLNKKKFATRSAWLMLAVAPVAAVFTSQAARAATDTWAPPVTPANNLWTTASNWGGTAPVSGDFLIFAGSNNTNTSNNFSGATFDGITFASGASSFTLGGNSIDLGFTTLGPTNLVSFGDIANNSSSTQNIALSGLTLDAGVHLIYNTSTGGMNISAPITQNKGSVAIFQPGSASINVTGSGLANDATGILGGWATFGGTNTVAGGYAALDVSGNVIAYTGYATLAGNGTFTDDATKNFSIISNATGQATTLALPATTTHMNTLLLASSGANTVAQIVAVGTGNTIILGQNGGIMNASGTGDNVLRALTVGASATGGVTSTGGFLTAGDGVHPANITFSAGALPNANTQITVNSVITDNATVNPGSPAAVSVTIDGGYIGFPNTANSYSGGTYVLSGRVNTAPTGSLGTGDVHIYAGGSINTTGTFANNMFLSGNGTLEAPALGFGALRLFGVGVAGAHLNGTVTLVGDAEITATNTSTPSITGLITGTGNLTLNRHNGSQQGGTINIGSLTAAPGNKNNYTGDTILAAPSAGTGNGGLAIIAPIPGNTNGNDNIMPHGLTGSYLGGPTGNLILDAVASGHNAIFDLNGTTQTINGLSSTNTFASSDVITSTLAGGVLVVGDSNASGTYYGSIQNGGGLSIQKIGSGTQTFTTALANAGSIGYSGDTNINGGTLVANVSMSSGNININTGSASTNFTGNGTFGNITLAANNGSNKASLSPGSSTSVGSIATLNAAALTVNGGNLLFDLSTASGTGDTINVGGPVTFNAAATIVVHGGSTGSYVLVNSTGGAITYGLGVTLANPASDPLVRPTTYTLDTTTNTSQIVVNVTGGSKSITWSGAASSTWDINNTGAKNFTSPGVDVFYNQDTVTFTDGAGNRTITISGSVQPASIVVNSSAGTDYTFSGGTIDGATSIAKSNGGNLTLASNNSYTGGTTIDAGTVFVGNGGTTGSLGTGNVNFTNPADVVFARTDAVTIANVITGPGNITVGKSAVNANVTLSGSNNYSGNTTVATGSTLVVSQFGSIAGSAGVILNGSTEIINGVSANSNFGNSLTVGAIGGLIKYGNVVNVNGFGGTAVPVTTTAGGNLTIDINDNEASIKTFAVTSTFTGGGNLIFTDSAGNPNNGDGAFDTVSVTGSMSSDTGNLTVSNAFRLQVNSLPSGNITVSNGAQLFANFAGTFANNFTLSGMGASTDIPSLGALRTNAGTTITGNVTLSSSALITVGTTVGSTLTLNGQISGPGALTLGSGNFTLTNLTATADSYGPVNAGSAATIIAGLAGRATTVTVNDASSIAHGGLQLQAGNLNINGFGLVVTNLSSAPVPGSANTGGNITDSSATPASLTFGSDNSTQTFAGVIADGGAGGNMSVSKTGTGTETFTGNQTYTGTTNVNAGGSLAFTATGSLSTTTLVTNNGALSFAAPTQTLASLSSTTGGTVNLNTTLLTLNAGSYAGSINDNGTLGGVITPVGATVTTGSINTNSLEVDGTHKFTSTTIRTLSKVNTLTVAGSPGAWSGALDITSSRLIVEDTSANRATDLATFKNMVANNVNNTVGIFSSTAAANGQVVVVSDNAVRLASFGAAGSNFGTGISNVDASSILITTAVPGDANLDGVVDIKDLQDLANHWQQPATDWSQADFDGNGVVALQDLQALANHWQNGVGAPGQGSGGSFSEALSLVGQFGGTSSVPEPMSLAILGLGGVVLASRRRKH